MLVLFLSRLSGYISAAVFVVSRYVSPVVLAR